LSIGIVTNMTYDFQGRLLTVTVDPGANQAVTSFEYDAISQITKVTRPDGTYFSYTYDNARRLTTVTSNAGETINYTRDLMGNITATNIKNTGGAIVFSQTQTFDELGRLLTNIGASSQTTAYAYEKNDNLKSVTDPRSGVYTYAYDSLNRLIRETDQESAQVNYTSMGATTSRRMPIRAACRPPISATASAKRNARPLPTAATRIMCAMIVASSPRRRTGAALSPT